jgi:hypothetical protein
MLFEELVQQHRLYRVIAHAVRLVFPVSHDQIGIHPLHVLRYKAELWTAIGINIFFIAKCDGFNARTASLTLFIAAMSF